MSARSSIRVSSSGGSSTRPTCRSMRTCRRSAISSRRKRFTRLRCGWERDDSPVPATCLNLASLREHQARLTPDRLAVVLRPYTFSYAQLDALASRVAAGLRALGHGPGDHIALACPNTPHFPIAYYGILKLGGVVVPLNVLLKPREIAFHLRDSDARALFVF